ncbi:unnamed protein product, partial [Effrenium voratum]
DTIHIPGIELGFKRPVLFERHAVGGEYGAGWKKVGKGRVLTTFFPENMDDGKPIIVDGREVKDEKSCVVVYDNPLDNVEDLAHVFFQRCLEAKVVPYVVTKKTVFKWQEGFWQIMSDVFDAQYKADILGIRSLSLRLRQHLISDAATMQIIRWTDGGFGMACHNYDGDMLTDEVAQVHRSPGFITSNLIGKREDGTLIKEFEASHGTVADLWHAHLRAGLNQCGEETSMNPLGMARAAVFRSRMMDAEGWRSHGDVVALLGAMDHSAALAKDPKVEELTQRFTKCCQAAGASACEPLRDLAGQPSTQPFAVAKAIFRSRPKRPPMALNLRASRLLWIAVGCAALLVADVPLCRLNYQMQLSYYVTPIKDELAPQAAACSGVFESNAQDQCVSFCQQVRKASEERQDCVMFARKWHILGKWAAEIFDFGRGVEQGPAHVNELFSRKSCEGVLQSVDKSNPTVNTFCALAAGVAMLAAFAAFAQVMGDLAETNLRKD